MGTTIEEVLKLLADQSRQDAHVSEEALEFEHDMMEYQGVDQQSVDILRGTPIQSGFTSSGIYYSAEARRQTGDQHTGSGNSHMTADEIIITIKKLCEREGRVLDLANPPFALCVQGDDSFLLIKPGWEFLGDAEFFKKTSMEFGFLMKFCLVTRDLSKCDYCSRIFYPVHDNNLGWMLGPKIGKVLQKISFSSKPIHCAYRHNAGIISSLKYDCSYIPFLREWFETMTTLTKDYAPYKQTFDHTIRASKYHVSDDVRLWDMMWSRYGVTQNDLTDFERSLSLVTSLPFSIETDLVDRCLLVDY
jgi:hypothetical protein